MKFQKSVMKNNIEYKCEECTLTFKEKSEVSTHNVNINRKCTHCRQIFITEKVCLREPWAKHDTQ